MARTDTQAAKDMLKAAAEEVYKKKKEEEKVAKAKRKHKTQTESSEDDSSSSGEESDSSCSEGSSSDSSSSSESSGSEKKKKGKKGKKAAKQKPKSGKKHKLEKQLEKLIDKVDGGAADRAADAMSDEHAQRSHRELSGLYKLARRGDTKAVKVVVKACLERLEAVNDGVDVAKANRQMKKTLKKKLGEDKGSKLAVALVVKRSKSEKKEKKEKKDLHCDYCTHAGHSVSYCRKKKEDEARTRTPRDASHITSSSSTYVPRQAMNGWGPDRRTCFSCGDQGHVANACPHRTGVRMQPAEPMRKVQMCSPQSGKREGEHADANASYSMSAMRSADAIEQTTDANASHSMSATVRADVNDNTATHSESVGMRVDDVVVCDSRNEESRKRGRESAGRTSANPYRKLACHTGDAWSAEGVRARLYEFAALNGAIERAQRNVRARTDGQSSSGTVEQRASEGGSVGSIAAEQRVCVDEKEGDAMEIEMDVERVEGDRVFASVDAHMFPAHQTTYSMTRTSEKPTGDAHAMPRAPCKLSAMVRMLGKKWNDKPQYACVYCRKNGHRAESCTAMPGDSLLLLDPWSIALIEAPQVELAEQVKGMSVDEAREHIDREAAKWNVGNPWLGSTKRRERLRAKLGMWKAIGASVVQLCWIAAGVPLRFVDRMPQKLFYAHHPAVKEHMDHVRGEHKIHLEDGGYVYVPADSAHVANPLLVDLNKGKKRMCLDMRYVNGFLPDIKFQMESLTKNVPDMIRKGDILFTTDISKAYYSIPMRQDAWKYMCWEHEGSIVASTVLPFGLSIAPFVFTKLFRPMLEAARVIGIRVIGMIDDFLWMARPEEAEETKRFAQWIFPALGLSLNEKCKWDTTDEAKFLGFKINSTKMMYVATGEAIRDTHRMVLKRLMEGRETNKFKRKGLQEVAGKIISLTPALHGARAWTRDIYVGAEAAKEMTNEELTNGALVGRVMKELEFWDVRLGDPTKNGLSIQREAADIQIHVDASETGWGAFMGGIKRNGELSAEVLGRSSTLREIVGMQLAMQAIEREDGPERWRGKRVTIHMDSQPAVRNLEHGGGPVPELVREVKRWELWREERGMLCSYVHVGRELNKEADEASKRTQKTETLTIASMERVKAWMWKKGLDASAQAHVPARDNATIRLRWQACRGSYVRAGIVVPSWPNATWTGWLREARQAGMAMRVGKAGNVLEGCVKGKGDEMWAVWVEGALWKEAHKH
jgi:hypothetical protein